jgi:hypothetical protein
METFQIIQATLEQLTAQRESARGREKNIPRQITEYIY